MPRIIEITLRDMATGQLGTMHVGPEFWLRCRITNAFWKKALPELHATVELTRLIEVPSVSMQAPPDVTALPPQTE